MAKTGKRVPQGVAARARAKCVPSHCSTTQPSSGPQQGSTVSAHRAGPRVAAAASHHSRNCWRPVGSWRPSHVARNALTAGNAQERASPSPRLHRAKTGACGLLKWGKWAWRIVVHAVTRGWQDIRSLLGVMGATSPPIPCSTEGCLVTSCKLSYRHFSKTYCRKTSLPLPAQGRESVTRAAPGGPELGASGLLEAPQGRAWPVA